MVREGMVSTLELFLIRFYLFCVTDVGEKDFSCKICGKNWYSKGALTEHMMVHSEERPFQCTECGTCFKKHSALKKHMVTRLS